MSNNSKNVGDLLNQQNVTWGWLQGGFKPSTNTFDCSPNGAQKLFLDPVPGERTDN